MAETEDQLLALYELTKADPGQLDIDRLLNNLVRQAVRLVKADGAFAVFTPSCVVRSPALLAPDLLARVWNGSGLGSRDALECR